MTDDIRFSARLRDSADASQFLGIPRQALGHWALGGSAKGPLLHAVRTQRIQSAADRHPCSLPRVAEVGAEGRARIVTSRSSAFPVAPPVLIRYSFHTKSAREELVSFEFDEAKRRANKDKHGIDFVEAQSLWMDDRLMEVPARTGDEPRFLVVAAIERRY